MRILYIFCLLCLGIVHSSTVAQSFDDECCFITEPSTEGCPCEAAYCSYLDVSNSFGKTLGVGCSYSSFGLRLAKIDQERLYYFDVRWNHLHDGSNSADAGIGVRFGDACKGCGANVFFDWRGYHSARFRQISGGIEGWIAPWEFHLDVYLPLQTVETIHKTSIDYEGGYYFRSKTVAAASQIALLTAGRRFALCQEWIPSLYGKVLAGPYYISNHYKQDRFGGMVRADFNFYEYLYLNAIYTADPINHSRFQAVVGITIPFGCGCETYCGDCCAECPPSLFYEAPERLDMIGINKYKKCRYNWNPE